MTDSITIGNCTLYHGDCIDIMPIIFSQIDMVLSDPPYGITGCSWDSIIPLSSMWKCINNLSNNTTPVVMTASQPFTSILGFSNIENLRYSWVWEKTLATGHLNAKRMPLKNHEDVLVFYKKQPVYNPQNLIDYNKITRRSSNGKCYGKSSLENFQEKTNYPRTIQAFKSVGENIHPTQKPVELMEYLIKTYTNKGDTVLDFAMGSGTTGIACVNTSRKFIGIELDYDYFAMALSRIKETEETTKHFYNFFDDTK